MEEQNTTRRYCDVCQYPLQTCICDAITPVTSQAIVSILQDPVESKHAKNTARLSTLILPKASIFIGTLPNDFKAVMQQVESSSKTLLVYPCESAVSLGNQSVDWSLYTHIVVLDGTWRKAKKLWLNNPWLHELDACSIEPEHTSNYRIRKRPSEQSLSTLEAIATTLNVVDGTPLAPFEQALNAMQQHWHDFAGQPKRQT